MALAVYLIVKGFRPSPITAGMVTTSAQPTQDPAGPDLGYGT